MVNEDKKDKWVAEMMKDFTSPIVKTSCHDEVSENVRSKVYERATMYSYMEHLTSLGFPVGHIIPEYAVQVYENLELYRRRLEQLLQPLALQVTLQEVITALNSGDSYRTIHWLERDRKYFSHTLDDVTPRMKEYISFVKTTREEYDKASILIVLVAFI